MAASVAIAGRGTLLKIGDGASPTEVFTAIAEVTSVSWDGVRVEFADVSHHESPSAFREKIPTLMDGGAVQVEGNYLSGNATQQGLITDMIARTRRNFKIVLTNADEWAFSAYIDSFRVNAPVDGKLSFSASLMITGAPTPPS